MGCKPLLIFKEKLMKQKVAVIGGGVAGITSAFLLQQKFDVTIFEKNSYLGGHTNTIDVKEDNQDLSVDTGFIVCNDKTYENFHKLLVKLNTNWRYADMSFSVHDESSGLQYGSKNIDTIFAQRKNILSPTFIKFLFGIQKFWSFAAKDVNNIELHSLPLDEYLKLRGINSYVIENFVLPISAAIWSTPDKLMLKFPLGIFLKFYSNHGLLSVFNQPKWQTVVGGSQSYVKSFKNLFQGTINLNTSINKVTRNPNDIDINFADGTSKKFDYIVIATHADQVLNLLSDPTDVETNLFNSWKYLANETILHTDSSFLPPNKRAIASWNYKRELNDDGIKPLSISYYMNKLQGFESKKDYIVTLNSRKKIQEDKIIRKFNYTHPHFTVDAMKTQDTITNLNGTNRTFYAGSYLRFGFHEDAVISGVNVGKYFGLEL
jgi:predicted NAD/FAD-binding protein